MSKVFKFSYLNKQFAWYQDNDVKVFSVAKDANDTIHIFTDIPFLGSKYWLSDKNMYISVFPVFKTKIEEERLFNEVDWRDSLRFYAIRNDKVEEISTEMFKMIEFISNE